MAELTEMDFCVSNLATPVGLMESTMLPSSVSHAFWEAFIRFAGVSPISFAGRNSFPVEGLALCRLTVLVLRFFGAGLCHPGFPASV